jgi:hypothetical protein
MGMVEMHAKSSGPRVAAQVATQCVVCEHVWAEHDVIAARYCAATVAGRFDRGCVCAAGSTVESPGGTD